MFKLNYQAFTKPEKRAVMYLCVTVSILPLFTILIFDFGIVPTVWYFLFFGLFKLRIDSSLRHTVPVKNNQG